MIKTKEDLKRYLLADKLMMSKYGAPDSLIKKLKHAEDYYVWKIIRNIRYLEYYENNADRFFYRLMGIIYTLKSRRYSRKYGVTIYPHVFQEGLCIYHLGPIYFSKKAKVGKNLILRPMTLVASTRDRKPLEVEIGDNVELSMGVSVLCKKIGRFSIINANSVVMMNVPPYAIVCGNPAKIVGFTMTPEDAYANEMKLYPENERIPYEVLKQNYNKYYKNRIKEIKEFIKH